MHTIQKKHVATLTQREFHSLSHAWAVMEKFQPSAVMVDNAVVTCDTALGDAFLAVDFGSLVNTPIRMSFALDKKLAGDLLMVSGASDVEIEEDTQQGLYRVTGAHYEPELPAVNQHVALPNHYRSMSAIGVPPTDYDPKTLKSYLKQKHSFVLLGVFDGQLEQLVVEGKSPYTFTSGMLAPLRGRVPDMILSSEVAFKHIGKKQSLQLGRIGSDYILEARNSLDRKADLVIYERLKRL